jgi:hypothetical protein
VEFPSVVAAVRCAIEVQRAMAIAGPWTLTYADHIGHAIDCDVAAMALGHERTANPSITCEALRGGSLMTQLKLPLILIGPILRRVEPRIV